MFNLAGFVTLLRFSQGRGFVLVSSVPKAQPYVSPGCSEARNERSETLGNVGKLPEPRRGGPNLVDDACAERNALGPPRWGLVDMDGTQPRVAPILAELALAGVPIPTGRLGWYRDVPSRLELKQVRNNS